MEIDKQNTEIKLEEFLIHSFFCNLVDESFVIFRLVNGHYWFINFRFKKQIKST